MEPDLQLLFGVVGACAKAAQRQIALDFLVDRRQVRSDVIVHNKVIGACEREGLWQITLNLLRKIQEAAGSRRDQLYFKHECMCEGYALEACATRAR